MYDNYFDDRIMMAPMFMIIVQKKAICVEVGMLRGGITPPPSLLLSGEKKPAFPLIKNTVSKRKRGW